MKYLIGAAIGALSMTQFAYADVCSQLESFAHAVELNHPGQLTETPLLGLEETECWASIGPVQGFGGLRTGLSFIECNWENSDAQAYTEDDVRDAAYHFHSCPALIFDVLEDYGDGIEYVFSYGEKTRLLLGNDEFGMHLTIARVE